MSEFSDIWGRGLTYPFSYVKSLEFSSSRDFIVGDPLRETNPTWFVFCVTNEEMLKLTSAVQAGLDLLYPDDWGDLIQIWEQLRQFPNDFPPDFCGEGSMTNFCDLVADCVVNDGGVRDAIRDLVEAGIFTSNDEGSAGSESVDCVWGGVFKIAEYVNDQNIAIADLVAAGSEYLDAAIGIFSNTPAGRIATWVNAASGFVASLLSATWSDPDYVEARACELFCLQMQTSDPQVMLVDTLQDWFNLYPPGSVPITEDTVWMLGGVAIGYEELLRRWLLGSDECDNDWKLCSCITFQSFNVPYNVAATSSPDPLLNGIEYVVSVKGVVTFNSQPSTDKLDFQWSTDDDWATYNPFGANNGALSFDLGGGAQFLPYQLPINLEEHGYSFKVIGEGNVITFRPNDSPISDNAGEFMVDIVLAT